MLSTWVQDAKNHIFENLKLTIIIVQKSSSWVQNAMYKVWRDFIRNCVSDSNSKMSLKTMSEDGIGWVTCKRQ